MRFPIWIPLVVAALLALLGSVFIVREGQSAIVLNLGRVVRTDIGPGLHFKWPLVESERRLRPPPHRATTPTPERYLTAEKKDVSVDFFAIGRIENLRTFYRADQRRREDRRCCALRRSSSDSLRNEINARTL